MKTLQQQNIELKAELNTMKEELKANHCKAELNTMKTIKEDELNTMKEELKELKGKQSSLAEEMNKRLNILASTQDIFNSISHGVL